MKRKEQVLSQDADGASKEMDTDQPTELTPVHSQLKWCCKHSSMRKTTNLQYIRRRGHRESDKASSHTFLTWAPPARRNRLFGSTQVVLFLPSLPCPLPKAILVEIVQCLSYPWPTEYRDSPRVWHQDGIGPRQYALVGLDSNASSVAPSFAYSRSGEHGFFSKNLENHVHFSVKLLSMQKTQKVTTKARKTMFVKFLRKRKSNPRCQIMKLRNCTVYGIDSQTKSCNKCHESNRQNCRRHSHH